MSHVPHELVEEFPNHIERMHQLKTHDAHFAHLADTYHQINREIHRIEAQVEAASDTRDIELRKQRLKLKDEINAVLTRAAD